MSNKKLILNKKWCKGCGICVEYCSKEVLILQDGKAKIQENKKCIFCGLCELRCPDYAIYIAEKSK